MQKVIDVVKNSSKKPMESFNRDKLHQSIRSACLSVRSPEGEAETIADHVTHAVLLWLENKPIVTSNDLRRIASAHLSRYQPDAAYFYHHHRYII